MTRLNRPVPPDTLRSWGRAWIYLWAHLAAHVVEEATTGFLAVWNPFLASLRDRTGFPFPYLEFDLWITVLIVVVALLAAATPLVYRGARGMRAVSYGFAALMIGNGINHLVSPLYLGRFLPGQFTSPLLLFASVWLIRQTRRASHHAPPPSVS